MTDIAINDEFNVVVSTDLETVEDFREIEQKLALTIQEYFFDHIGDRNTSNVVRKLRMAAKRAARETDGINQITSVEVDNQEGDSLWLYITYNHGEEFEFEVI